MTSFIQLCVIYPIENYHYIEVYYKKFFIYLYILLIIVTLLLLVFAMEMDNVYQYKKEKGKIDREIEFESNCR